jgi:hypothetical protein
MAVSTGLAIGLAAGVGAGAAAANQGVATPGGDILTGVGVEGFSPDLPELDLPEIPTIGTEIDQSAVNRARTAEAERIRKRRGRSSTIVSQRSGILAQAAETTGGLLGS